MTARALVGLPLQQRLSSQIASVWWAFCTVRELRVGTGKLVGIQECGLLTVDVRQSEGRRSVGTGDLRIDIVSAADDCRIFRLIGLARLHCQKEGMEVENVGSGITGGENCWRQ